LGFLFQFPFKMGVGGILGNGRQYMSCVTIDDVVGGIHHCLTHDELSGPVNLVDPYAVTNREFTNTLGRILHRPTIFPAPAFALRLALGEMADALLLSSTRVQPKKLLASGYQFRFPDLESGLRHPRKTCFRVFLAFIREPVPVLLGVLIPSLTLGGIFSKEKCWLTQHNHEHQPDRYPRHRGRSRWTTE
jgi:hypothetical protein